MQGMPAMPDSMHDAIAPDLRYERMSPGFEKWHVEAGRVLVRPWHRAEFAEMAA